MVKVLFVCLGNICRSPMAEGVFQAMVNTAGLAEHIRVDSAGTSGYHAGERAHSGTLAVLKKHGIDYNGRSRPLTRQDFLEYDYILAMDEDNLMIIHSRQPAASKPIVRLFLDYAEGVTVREVPDPYYTGAFDEVYQLVEAGCRGLLQQICADHQL